MSKSLDVEGMRELLREEVRRAGTQEAWARLHGVSPQYVNDVLLRRKDISSTIARLLGYERRMIYLRRNGGRR